MPAFVQVILWIIGTALVLFLILTFVIAVLMYQVAYARVMPSYGAAVLGSAPQDPEKLPEDEKKHLAHFEVTKSWLETREKEDWWETSFDGLKLYAMLLKPDQPSKKAAIVIHGFHAQGIWDFDGMIPHYVQEGFNVIVPDDRAHNRSEGKWLGFGWNDRRDAVTWLKRIVKEFGPDCEIVLHGVSMGGATVMMASGEPDLPKQLKCIINDCGYTSALDEFTHIFPIKWMAPVILFWDNFVSKFCNGYFLTEASSVRQLAKTDKPFLFIHGGADDFVPTWMVYENYGACASEDKHLYIADGAAHALSYTHDPEKYERTVDEFLAKYL